MLKALNFLYVFLMMSQSIFSNTYKIKLLDRANLEQVQQVRQLFATSHVQLTKDIVFQDLEKWLIKKTYNVLVAINKKGLVCGVAIYYLTNKNQLFLRVMAILPAYPCQGIASKLLHELELIPNVAAIETNMTKEHIAFYKLFKKLGYKQTEQYLKMSKSFSQALISDGNISKYPTRLVDEHNQTEIAQFAALFDLAESGGSWTTEEMKEFMMTYKNYYFLASFDKNNQVVAGLIYNILSTHWEIYILAVHKDYRRQGMATELLKNLEKLALQQDIKKLMVSALPTNYAAIACYKKQGFVEENMIFKMEKKLS